MTTDRMMNSFTAHRLRFVTQVQATIELNQHQGSAIRGALYHALRDRFCGLVRGPRRTNREAECAACPLVATCPVATLVSTLKPGSVRGQDVPRPFTVQPPLPGTGGHLVEADDGRFFFRYRPGEVFEFGLTLYAQALQLFPYVVLAAGEFEDRGIGRRLQQADGRWRPGTLAIQQVWAENPLTGERQSVMQADDQMVQVPDIPITHQQVCEWAKGANGERRPLRSGRMAMRFQTPTRLIERKRLLKPEMFRFRPFFHRLWERLESLSRDFSDTPLAADVPTLLDAAEQVQVVDNQLQWEEVRSYSTRQRKGTPVSGLLGTVVLEAEDWSPFLPWLTWGQFVHVGKDAVKGNGWYELEKLCPSSKISS